jgi:hypothetical protein
MPASTSPAPAVASQGGAFVLMTARPSGAATTIAGEGMTADDLPEAIGRVRVP